MEEEFNPRFKFMEEVWTIHDNRVHHGPVIGVNIKGNPKGFITESFYTISCHDTGQYLVKPDHLLFKSKEELLNSL